jgi:hypothetical protein
MRRLAGLVAIGAVIGAVALVLTRARASSTDSTPALASAPVHMSVGDAAPEVSIPGEADAAVS